MGEIVGAVLLVALFGRLLRMIPGLRLAQTSAIAAVMVTAMATAIACTVAAVLGTANPATYLIAGVIYAPIAAVLAALRGHGRRSQKETVETERFERPRRRRASRAGTVRENRRFVHCAECDARNNARREACWQCSSPLASAPTTKTDAEDVHSNREESRNANLQKMVALIGPTCPQCGAVNDRGSKRCSSCDSRLR